jgi:hypothetical protein
MRPLILLFSLLLAMSPASADAPLTLQTLLAKHAQAVGPIDQVQSRRVHMRGIGMAPFELPIVIEAARPNLLRKEVSVQGNTLVTAFDGKQAWKTDPFVSGGDTPMAPPPLEAKALAAEADFDGTLVNSAAKGIKLAYKGPATVDGKPAHEIAVTLADGSAMTVWLDAATYLEVKRNQPALIAGAMKPIDIVSSDYRAVSGVQLPHKIEILVPGVTQKMMLLTDSAEMNVKIDPARFAKAPAK